MKLENKKNIKRLVIFFFYDNDGIVDRYVPYLLEDMKKNCSELFVVVNGKLTPEGRKVLKSYSDDLLVRENIGFDVWAYKAALTHYGWDKIATFDEVVFMNHTIYGPLYPFSEMFDVMNKKDVDFWGITKYHKLDYDPFGTISYGYIPEHIQSHFIAIRSSMLNSHEFHNYWDNMGEIKTYMDAVGKHEAIFTKHFNDCGFTSEAYVETDDLKGFSEYPLMFDALEMVKNRRCPIVKRKAFFYIYWDAINKCLGEPTIEVFNYIKNELDYDVSMIWENLLRTENMADIKNRMHLNYVLPKNYLIDPANETKLKVALVMHVYYEDQLDEVIDYSQSMPITADIFFTTTNEKMVKLIQEKSLCLKPRKIIILTIDNRGRDVSSLLIGFAPYYDQYDVICFAHDKKTTQLKPYSIGRSFSYKCFENILGSKEYVQNIIYKFEQEPQLGMIMPPPPNHSDFYGRYSQEWGPNFQNTKKLAEVLELKCNLDESKEPISPLGTMFWVRPKALKVLFDKKWKYEDFPKEPNGIDGTILHAIERIYGPVVQDAGYYSAWCINDQFASIELTNQNFMLRQLTMTLFYKIGPQARLDQTCNILYYLDVNKSKHVEKQKLKTRLKKHPNLYNFLRKIYHAFKRKPKK